MTEDGTDPDESMDHDELIVGNLCELIISIVRGLGPKFYPYFKDKTGEMLFKRLHPLYSS